MPAGSQWPHSMVNCRRLTRLAMVTVTMTDMSSRCDPAAWWHAAAAPTNPQEATPRIMTGELAPARHVPSAATRGWEPGSNLPLGALPGSLSRTQADLGPGDRHIRRTKRNRSDSEDTPPRTSRKLKWSCNSEVRVWG